MIYEHNSIKDVEAAMAALYKVDRNMLQNYTVKEIIDDAVTSGLMSPDIGNFYLEEYKRGRVCQY